MARPRALVGWHFCPSLALGISLHKVPRRSMGKRCVTANYIFSFIYIYIFLLPFCVFVCVGATDCDNDTRWWWWVVMMVVVQSIEARVATRRAMWLWPTALQSRQHHPATGQSIRGPVRAIHGWWSSLSALEAPRQHSLVSAHRIKYELNSHKIEAEPPSWKINF